MIRPGPELVATVPGAAPPSATPGPAEAARLAELSPALLTMVNSEWVVVFASAAWKRLLAWDPGELVGRDLLHEQEREELVAKLRVAREEPGSELFFVGRTAAKDGSWRWIDWRIRFEDGRWYCAGQLAPESGRARSERMASESQLLDAQRVAGVGSFQFDLATEELRWSDEMYRIFSFEPGRALRRAR